MVRILKFITWNVNGLRACLQKGLLDYLSVSSADIIALQEIKVNIPTPDLKLFGYAVDWNFAERTGYSGTLCMFRKKPLSIKHGLNDESLDNEGRLITLEYPDFYFVNVYVPNSQGSLDRWYFRLDWDVAFSEYLCELQVKKPVIVCGDFNVARDYIDVYPENLLNVPNPHGFMSEERDGFKALLDAGFIDAFRELFPTREIYTWWSSRLHKRRENRGWRLDYFLVSRKVFGRVRKCEIRGDVFGSDHAPVELVIYI